MHGNHHHHHQRWHNVNH